MRRAQRGQTAAAVLVAALLTACTQTIHQRNGLPVVTNAEEIRVHVAGARLRMDSALFRVDVGRLLRQMTPDVSVVLANGDSASGHDSVAALINRNFARSIGARFQMFPSKRVTCLDGSAEYDGDFIGYVAFADQIDTLVTKYAAKWRNGGESAWLLERLVFGAGTSDAHSVAGVCERVNIAQFDASRVHLSVVPAGLSYQLPGMQQSLEGRLQQLGYQTSGFPVSLAQVSLGFSVGSDGGTPGVAAARWRVMDAVSLEAVGNYTPQTFASVGKNATTTSLIRVEVKNQMAGAMIEYDWGRWRAGVGAAFVATDWNEIEYNYSLPFQGGSSRTQSSSSTVALLVNGVFMQPISSRIGVEAWVMSRFGQDQMPAVGQIMSGVPVRLDQTMVGAALVFAF